VIKQVWEEGKMPTDWRAGIIFPVPKKKVKMNVKRIEE
jgi:hypothetical protein